MGEVGTYLAVVLPSVGVGAIFYFAMRSLLNADRAEREALAEAERELQERAVPEEER